MLTIASFPGPHPTNPYLSAFCRSLEEAGARVIAGEYFGLSWLRENRGRIDYILFHWPSFHYSDEVTGKRTLLALAKFLLKMMIAKAWGYRFVWIMHNVYPHERQGGFIEWLCRFVFVHNVDVVFVLFEGAREILWETFRRRRGVCVVPHGNYTPAYPVVPSAAFARQTLKLPADGYVFLSIGQIRRYKGVHLAVAALRQLADRDCRLYVVGQAAAGGYIDELRRLADGDPRIAIVATAQPLSDEAIGDWVAACDCLLAPYQEVHGSGVLYLAATFGKPMVAPKRGVFVDVANESFVATFNADQVDALSEALSDIRHRDLAIVRESALRFSEKHRWSDIAVRAVACLSEHKG